MMNASSRFSMRRRAAAGFTLIELMIVVAAIAILAAIALPSYQKSIMKARRTDAKNALLDVASREERYYSINSKYTPTLSDLGYASAAIMSSGASYYGLTLAAPTGASPPSFSASAAPSGAQVNDGCGTFGINNLGQQTVTGTDTSCW